MYGKCFDKLIESIGDMVTKVENATNALREMTAKEEPLTVWEPYRCRICGKAYENGTAVRACMRDHTADQQRAFARGAGGRHAAGYAGARVAPRAREKAMRGTEMRRREV